jgi:microcystin-dependent protein
MSYLADALDVDVLYGGGTDAQRIAAAHQAGGGKFWWSTDTKQMWYDDGTTWQLVGPISSFVPGDIKIWPAATPPTGWLLCDGSSLLRAGQYAALFAVVGTSFGSADGTHFNLPDMRGRVVAGYGTTASGSHIDVATVGNGDATNPNARRPTHKHTVGDPGHGHGVTDPNHGHGVTDPQHGHGVTDPQHNHSVTETPHNHTVSEAAHNHTVNETPHGHGITDNGHSHSIPTALSSNPGAGGPVSQSFNGYVGDKQTNLSGTGISVNGASTGISLNGVKTNIALVATATGIAIQNKATGVTVNLGPTGVSVVSGPTGVSVQAGGTGVTVGPVSAPVDAVPYLVMPYVIKF